MHLLVKDSTQVIDTTFAEWLCDIVKTTLLGRMTKYNFDNWDNFLSNSNLLVRLYTRKYSTQEVLLFAANNICAKCDTPGEVVIRFNPHIYVPGFDRLKLDTVVRLINYGTLDTKGIPIFTDTFDEIADKIEEYIQLYYV